MSRVTTTAKSNAVQLAGFRKDDLPAPVDCTNRIYVLMDKSGSMEQGFPDPWNTKNTRQQSAITAMRAMVNVSDRKTTSYALTLFDHDNRNVLDYTNHYDAVNFMDIPKPSGGTLLSSSLKFALEKNPTRVVALTDGETAMPDACIELAHKYKARGIPIDTIAIGDSGDALLMQLSEITGGVFKRCSNPQDLVQHFIELEPANYLRLTHKG